VQLRDVAVLIADQRMPGMSGIDLCEKVRRRIRIRCGCW
jgi:CheY-like chemotaxis protein